MRKIMLFMIASILSASPSFARYIHTHNPPEPVFQQANFLRIPGIPEMNLDFALAWTDSAAGLFIQPFDAVVLHVIIDGEALAALEEMGLGYLAGVRSEKIPAGGVQERLTDHPINGRFAGYFREFHLDTP